MTIDNVVNINISRSAPAVSRAGFGTMLILGPNADGWGSDRVRSYTSASALLDDGFTSSDAEYLAAAKAFSQQVRPQRVLVGLMATKVAQVQTCTPDVSSQEVQDFTVTINGTDFTFESDANPTAEEVVTGLIALVNAGDEPVTASGTTTLVLTADNAGVSFTLTVSANLANADTTASHGPVEDLAEISAINDDYYAVCYTGRLAAEILKVAAYVETVRKIYIPCSDDSDVITTATDDVASLLQDAAYDRSAFLYSGVDSTIPEAAWLGRMLPTQPGAANWKFKTLTGVTADDLTDTQRTNALGKKANIYTNVGGSGMTEEATVASGEYLDVIVGIDWLHVNMQADVFQVLRDNDKVAFTNDGINSLVGAMDRRLQLAVQFGILASYEITVPDVAAIASADIAARHLTGLEFSGVLAGAVNKTTINGYVTVS